MVAAGNGTDCSQMVQSSNEKKILGTQELSFNSFAVFITMPPSVLHEFDSTKVRLNQVVLGSCSSLAFPRHVVCPTLSRPECLNICQQMQPSDGLEVKRKENTKEKGNHK